MSNAEHRELGQGKWVLAAVGLFAAAVLVGCISADRVEVSTGGVPPASAPSTVPVKPGEKFQGAVAAVDVDANELTVTVGIVWTPAVKAVSEDRRVVVGSATRWTPAAVGLGQLRVGEEVQVEAVALPDGTWQARQVQLFDLD